MRPTVRTLIVIACAALAMLCGTGRASAQLASLISPGPLSKAHAKLEGVGNCAQCHALGQQVTAAKCLTCHAPVAERIARKSGVHKAVTGDCTSCHAEHAGANGQLRPFDEASFDHNAVTGFPLTGKHALGAEKCAACHKGRSFLEARAACVSCHADVHKGGLGANCTTCHSTQAAFKASAASFDHSKSAFKLTGAHRTVSCANCHVNAVYKGLKFAACVDCHKEPHKGAFGATCTSCHTTESWKTKSVDHARTAFPLTGAHVRVDCASCHGQSATKTKLKSDTCASCHADAHRGAFKQDCGACHTDSSFKGGRFDHSTTRFALTAKHVGLACEKCHRPGTSQASARSSAVAAATSGGVARAIDFRGLKTTCVSCHEDVHKADLGTACESCHTAAGFTMTAFTHKQQAQPFFAGLHAKPTCRQCHAPALPDRPVRTGASMAVGVRFTTTSRTCATCHADVHLGQLGAACERCHTIDTPKFAVAFDHSATSFALQGRHVSVACHDCHKSETGAFPAGKGTAVRLKGLETSCLACHADVHLGQVGTACERCHSVETPKFAVPAIDHTATTSFPLKGKHASVACRDCHKTETGAFPAGPGTAIRLKGFDTSCRACHADVHLGQVATACERCHSVDTFHVAKYAHTTKAAQSLMTGAHARAACAACHKKEAGTFPAGKGTAIRFAIGTSCVSCHVDQHRGTLGPNCANCHRP